MRGSLHRGYRVCPAFFQCSVCCRKISAMMPDEGAPIVRPSCWITMSWLLVKQFCLVITYHFKSSCCIWGYVMLCFNMFARIVLVSFTGMFEYMLMSKDAKVKCGEIGVCCKFWIGFFAFFRLKAFRSGAIVLIFCVNNLDSL